MDEDGRFLVKNLHFTSAYSKHHDYFFYPQEIFELFFLTLHFSG